MDLIGLRNITIKTLAFCLSFFCTINLNAQLSDSIKDKTVIDYSPNYVNSISLELGGSGGYYSLNYNYKILDIGNKPLVNKIGLSYWFNDFQSEHYLPILTELDYLLINKTKIEVNAGIGGAIWFIQKKNSSINTSPIDAWNQFFTINSGVKYKLKNMYLEVNVYWLTNFQSSTPWAGLSIGKNLNNKIKKRQANNT